MALRSLPAGAGFKPPRAALAEDRCRERRGMKADLLGLARYGSRRRAQANHRSGVETALDDIKTKGRKNPWDEPIGHPAYWMGGVRRRGGVSSIRAHLWNCGNSES